MSNTTSKIDVVVSPEQLSSIDAEQEKNGASRLLTDYWVVCGLCQGQAACSFFHSACLEFVIRRGVFVMARTNRRDVLAD